MDEMIELQLAELEKDRTVRGLLNYICQCSGSKAAFNFRNGEGIAEISRERFFSDCRQAMSFFGKMKQDKIALLADNSYMYIVAFFAISSCGKAAVLMDRSATLPEAVQMLDTSECEVLFYSEAYEELARGLAEEKKYTIEKFEKLPELFAAEAEYTGASPDTEAIAVVLFTSGTTGVRKVVPLSHGNLSADAINTCKLFQLRGKMLATLPFFHSYGLMATVVMPLVEGCTIFINDSLRHFVEDIAYCQSYALVTVPAIIEMAVKMTRANKKPELLRRLLGPEFSIIVSGGGPLNKEVQKLYASIGVYVHEGFGITECSSVVTFNGDHSLYGDSLGIPIEGCEVKLSPEGEILVRGDNVMKGYYKSPEETEKGFLDGWFRTGDLGRIGEHGELYLTGRIKKLIILSNGDNIPAEPLEELLYELPYLKEVLVRGINDVITAEVYPYPEAGDVSAMLDEDVEKINRSLPLKSCIMKTIIRDTEFPKTASNKIRL